MIVEQFNSFVNKTTDEMLGAKGLEQENLNDMFSSYTHRIPTPTQINAGNVTYEYGDLYADNTVGKALNDFYEELNNKVTDVQVNGVSVVTDGVANVPIASATTPGTVKVDSAFGIYIIESGENTGKLGFSVASDAQVKLSLGPQHPIPSAKTSMAAFYGLAKAAGDTTQSQSSNTVGNYTDSAKSAIQMMLGIAGIVGNVEDATASQEYSVGDAFLHGGSLYKATSSIVTNDAIVPGTNCEQTNLINLIKGV